MEIYVAGAGAGKTTNMASHIIKLRENTPVHKIIYCITFTNNAADSIKNKLENYYAVLPDNIIVSTIHSFLYREFIKPYYYLLYGKQFIEISTSKLPDEVKYKNAKIKTLENNNILHQTVIPERAKWVVYKKSTDKKTTLEKRKVILSKFMEYCGAICIDEAQDIDSDMLTIFESLDCIGIQLLLMGDPKQDLKGNQCFRKLIEARPDEVKYLGVCYRCPQCHIKISNRIISHNEQQFSDKIVGSLNLFFESDIECGELIKEKHYDLMYISSKKDQFLTHKEQPTMLSTATLIEEIEIFFKTIYHFDSNIIIKRAVYYYANKLITMYSKLNDKQQAMNKVFKDIHIEKQNYAAIINAIPDIAIHSYDKSVIYVNSIDIIKGQEGNLCLFVLTTDLVPYLFDRVSENNKTKNRLYVALTRSLNTLDIYVTDKVEKKYSRDRIISFFNR